MVTRVDQTKTGAELQARVSDGRIAVTVREVARAEALPADHDAHEETEE